MNKWRKYFGPSTLVAAAFIGPGTLTICTLAGVQSGYSLLWALLFSVLVTIFLQEMAARLGLISQQGLGEAIRRQIRRPFLRLMSVFLVMSAIVIGNAAYEAGNISGAVLGLEGIFPALSISEKVNLWPLLILVLSFVLLFSGSYRLVERVLIALVVLMSLVFLITAIQVQPSITGLFKGFFQPSIPEGELLLVVGLIGTTVVPYNLFLHASSVSEKWKEPRELSDLRIENAVGIGLGGLISVCIVITSAAVSGQEGQTINSAADMAVQLEPLLGSWSRYFLAMGLFAAGITSAITAPLAAAYAVRGVLGWEKDWKDPRFRLVWIFILLTGGVFAVLGHRPVEVIRFAQITNGILLPVLALFLVYIVNGESLPLPFRNKPWQNVLAGLIIIVLLLISFRTISVIFGN
jgi:manganese transport protein